MTVGYTRCGKQVMCNGEHIADASDELMAEYIVEVLSLRGVSNKRLDDLTADLNRWNKAQRAQSDALLRTIRDLEERLKFLDVL